MQNNSTLVKKSRYVSGGVTEVSSVAIEWWERANFQAANTDIFYVVEDKFAGRLDLIAQQFLEDSRLWWVIAQFNAILDPYSEIYGGRILRIPIKDRVQAMLVGKTGGIPSAREVPINSITPIV